MQAVSMEQISAAGFFKSKQAWRNAAGLIGIDPGHNVVAD